MYKEQDVFAARESVTTIMYTAINVHGNFHLWFTWGFFSIVASCLSFFAYLLVLLIQPALIFACQCTICYISCNSFAWYITGLVFRLRQAGAYASGDYVPLGFNEQTHIKNITAPDSLYQYESGYFIWQYYVATWVFIPICCVLTCCYSIYVTCVLS